ncbi:MAG: Mbeg1-like protein [Candidatus Enteromonas sp.]
MNINGYIRQYGKQTFEELPFNEVDALILSELSYINFHLVSPTTDNPGLPPVALKDVNIGDPFAFYRGSVDAVFNINMVLLMRRSKRFRDCKVGLCLNVFSKENINQFFAMTIFLPNGAAFVAFRGTDTSMLGWQEDFILSFQEKILAQEQAVAYLAFVQEYLPERFYVGGHSKGGNLAMYSALNSEESLQNRMIRVYSFDGPGFRKKGTEYSCYPRMHPKLAKYITKNDIIGMMFNVLPETKIVDSTGWLFGGHDPFYWQVRKDMPAFVAAGGRSESSKTNVKVMADWLATMSDDDKKLLWKFLFQVFSRRNNVYELTMFGLMDVIFSPTVLRQYTPEEQEKIKGMITRLRDFYFSETSKRKKKNREIKKIMDEQEDRMDQ